MKFIVVTVIFILNMSMAYAKCSRPIVVPVAATGLSVQIKNDVIDGVYPDFLRKIGAKIGCEFVFIQAPRARVEKMVFKSNEADVFIPSSQNAERDKTATFIYLTSTYVGIVSKKADLKLIKSFDDFLNKNEFRGAFIRSYSWGDEYDGFIKALENNNKVDFMTDIDGVLRMINKDRAQYTLLPYTLLYSAIQADPKSYKVEDFVYNKFAGIPLSRGGAYLSEKTLSPNDFKLIRDALVKGSKDGSLEEIFLKYYPKNALKNVIVFGSKPK